MAKKPEIEPELVDTSHLTDADWAEINRLKRAWQTGGSAALSKAMGELATANPGRFMSVMAAYFPTDVREVIKDEMAERGMTEEDLRELIRKLERPTGRQ
jgi:hypothetical protein